MVHAATLLLDFHFQFYMTKSVLFIAAWIVFICKFLKFRISCVLVDAGSPFWTTVTFGFGTQLNPTLVSTRASRGTSLEWPAAQERCQLKVFPLSSECVAFYHKLICSCVAYRSSGWLRCVVTASDSQRDRASLRRCNLSNLINLQTASKCPDQSEVLCMTDEQIIIWITLRNSHFTVCCK